MTKRYASHYVFLPEAGYLRQHVVEVEDGYVVRVFPLEGETEDVEWLPGVISLFPEGSGGGLVPCWLYPFDFKAMQPVAGTRRRRLL